MVVELVRRKSYDLSACDLQSSVKSMSIHSWPVCLFSSYRFETKPVVDPMTQSKM